MSSDADELVFSINNQSVADSQPQDRSQKKEFDYSKLKIQSFACDDLSPLINTDSRINIHLCNEIEAELEVFLSTKRDSDQSNKFTISGITSKGAKKMGSSRNSLLINDQVLDCLLHFICIKLRC